MNWSKFFKNSNSLSAPVARERLQTLLAHERSMFGRSNLIGILKEEIFAAISRHVAVESEKVQIKMDRGAKVSTLELQVEIPNTSHR